MSTASSEPPAQNSSSTSGQTSNAVDFMNASNNTKTACAAQWQLMWTVAAYTSEIPDPIEKRDINVFYSLLVDQCTEGPAANCYKDSLKAMPPRYEYTCV
eukprot:GHVR01183036.1.p1 GENE.GHVR01183036.1~~GHVR01183036.1.p1  ORF type:complete len:100 (-),score=6.15 GHVR01183036.1:173-472(-)